jgi:hypothetical protein
MLVIMRASLSMTLAAAAVLLLTAMTRKGQAVVTPLARVAPAVRLKNAPRRAL